MKENNVSIYQKKFINYPYGIVFISFFTLPLFFVFVYFLFIQSKEILILAFISPIIASVFFTSLLMSIYIENENIIFMAINRRKIVLPIKDLLKIDEWHGLKGTGYYFANNKRLYFPGGFPSDQKKIDEYKQFVFWLNDYKKSLYPEKEGIKIGQLLN